MFVVICHSKAGYEQDAESRAQEAWSAEPVVLRCK